MSHKDESDSDVNSSFVNYSGKDTQHGGAKGVIDKEFEHLINCRKSDTDNLKGLSLSGGGIRSASFCLGVVQALANANKLKEFDYLSTVSGGGYLGGALSWAWLGKWRTDSSCKREFGTGPEDFPYGSGQRYSNPDPDMDRDQASMMRHLRQNGKYLVPGKGITLLSFLSVIFRSISMGFVTLIALSSLFYHVLHLTPIFQTGPLGFSYIMTATLAVLLAYLLSLLGFGIFAIFHRKNEDDDYLWRRRWEISIKHLLILTITILSVELVDLIRALIESEVEAGAIGTLAGAFVAWKSQQSGSNDNSSSLFSFIPKMLIVCIGILTMFLGLFILADQIAIKLHTLGETALYAHIGVVAIVLLSSWVIPINKVSIHRYYRDRLMETFMPDICKIFKPEGIDTHVANVANKTPLHDCVSTADNAMPYHIINTNIILVESDRPKFRSRCGDNFILSPLYCGSNATGWQKTNVYANGTMTLPTAVAISGAAANSDSGVAGEGLTVNPLVSAIMSIFNLRLGFWSVNPNPDHQSNQKTVPNYLSPGFRGVLNRSKLNEKADFVQLSDGGHFENLAMYELLRRRCKTIVCCDAEQDNNFIFSSLSNIIEKARVDFGITIDINCEQLDVLKCDLSIDKPLVLSKKGYLVADIHYPGCETPGKLIYIKSTLPETLSADVMGYRNSHPDFPHETTADQFFTETQMEAYRCLGLQITNSMLNDSDIQW